jgi:RNA polymerase sigma-70 factor, ECF subfamily
MDRHPHGIPGAGAAAAPAAPTFAAWYAGHWEPARRLATRLVGDPTDGEDIAATVLLSVWERWERTGLPDAPGAYLNRAIRNRVASHFQRRDRERHATQRLGDGLGAAVEDPQQTVTDRIEVDELLARLPDDERRTVALRYLADLPCDDTARVLGIRPVSVRSRIHRSRRRLALATAA